MNKGFFATRGHIEYKDVLLNFCSFSCFDNKIYTQNNGYDGLDLGYRSNFSLSMLFESSVSSRQLFSKPLKILSGICLEVVTLKEKQNTLKKTSE